MKTTYVLFALVLLLALALVAQNPGRAIFSTYFETVPALVPDSTTTVYSESVWLEMVTLTNTTGSAVSCTISDRQSPARPVLASVSVAAYSVYVMPFNARFMPSGVTWSCADASAVVGYIRAKR